MTLSDVPEKPVVTCIIPFRDRDPRRIIMAATTLTFAADELDLEVVVADCGSRDIEPVRRAAELAGASLVECASNHWNKPKVLNEAIRQARGEFILCADVDILWPRGSLASAVARLRILPQAITAFQTRDLPEHVTEEALKSPSTLAERPEQLLEMSMLHSRWGNGVLLFPRDAALSIGGYDERLSVYGIEDLDFCRRLQQSGYSLIWTDPSQNPIFHVWHTPLNERIRRQSWATRALERNRRIYRESRSVVRNVVGGRRAGQPLVSVAIATKDRSELLADALSSVLCQTVQDFEILVVDDGSTDGTKDVVLGFDDPRIRYFYQEPAGISAARNRALDEARGLFTAVMDDDDLMPPWRLERSFEHVHAGEHGVVGSFVTFSDVTGEMVTWQDPFPTLLGASVRGGFAGHPTWMIRTDVLKAFRYDESFSSAVDNNIALRMVRSGVRLRHSGQILNLRRVHDKQVTAIDSRFQGRGAKLDTRWLHSGLSPEQVRENAKAGAETQVSRVLSADDRAEVMAYLPDHLVRRALSVRVVDRSVVEELMSEYPGAVGVEAVYDGRYLAQLDLPEVSWRRASDLVRNPAVEVTAWKGSARDFAPPRRDERAIWTRVMECWRQVLVHVEPTGAEGPIELVGSWLASGRRAPSLLQSPSSSGDVRVWFDLSGVDR